MTTHPEDQENLTLLIARRDGANVGMTWPKDLATARYLWKKLGVQIAEAEFIERDGADDDDEIVADVQGDQIIYGVPKDVRLARYLWHKLDGALCDAEWKLYQESLQLREKMMASAARRVEIGDARSLKNLKLGHGRRN